VETVWSLTKLIVVFLKELTLANIAVAHDLLTPRSRLRPGIIRIPLEAETDQEITILANLLTLTPGTTSIDVSEDRSTLYLHVMYLDKDGPEKTREAIKREMEARLLRVTR
jgi:multicomponent Na+:H+ antiporter subunit E